VTEQRATPGNGGGISRRGLLKGGSAAGIALGIGGWRAVAA
jgi:hypothetical protein